VEPALPEQFLAGCVNQDTAETFPLCLPERQGKAAAAISNRMGVLENRTAMAIHAALFYPAGASQQKKPRICGPSLKRGMTGYIKTFHRPVFLNISEGYL